MEYWHEVMTVWTEQGPHKNDRMVKSRPRKNQAKCSDLPCHIIKRYKIALQHNHDFLKMYNSIDLYTISQVILAFPLDVLIYDLLENRRIDDVNITNIFPLFF